MPALNPQIFYPMFAMFSLSLVALVVMFRRRTAAVKSGLVKVGQFKTYVQESGPDKMIQASRHFSNLFEAPILFYVICILGMLFSEGTLFVALAWLYVLARSVHAYVHLGSNKLIPRMSSYGFGWLMLVAMWVLVLVHITL